MSSIRAPVSVGARPRADSFFGSSGISASVEAASSQACGCMLNAMKNRSLALAVTLATANAVYHRAGAQAQIPRPMSSQAVNDRAVVMGILAARFSLQRGRCHERCRDV